MRHVLALSRMVVLLAAIPTLGCGQTGTETDNPLRSDVVQLQRSSKAYLTEVDAPAADSESLRTGARAFAFDLFRQVAQRAGADENLFLGTHSVHGVLAMSSAGARGATEAEIASALRHGLTPEALAPAMNALAHDLREGTAGTSVRYDALGSLWLANDHKVADPFLDVLSQHYDTGVYLANFSGDVERTRASINDWVSTQTNGLIPELFAAGAISPLTELALTNAAYLSAPWLYRLDPDATRTREFTLVDGTAVDVPMMSRLWSYPFAFDVDWRALELRFDQVNMGMVFVLPNQGEFTDLQMRFDAALAEQVVARLDASPDYQTKVVVQVPRFDFASNLDLRPSLEGLGVVTSFDALEADFTGIDPSGHLYVDRFVHRTTVSVDENGTTAAVATGQVMEPSPIVPSVVLNRPFIFFIYDHGTGSVLFVGRLMRPAGEAHAPSETTPKKTDAETICSTLAQCQNRTMTGPDCLAAISTDSESVVRRCADCIRLGADECGGLRTCRWGHGDVCDATTCAAYCPNHAF